MRRQKTRLSNRNGFTMILAVLMMTIFIGAAAFAVDFGHAQVMRATARAASDAAALAGIAEYSATASSDRALAEAQSFASRFRIDGSTLTVLAADFAIGNWSGTAFTAGGTPTNAARAIVRYTGSFAFAPVLNISSHTTVDTSVAVGSASKSVTKSTCVAPVVISYQGLLDQLKEGKGLSDSLTSADIITLLSAGPADTVNLAIPNGSKVTSLADGQYYQVELPPVYTAGGVSQTGQTPSASEYKNAYTCKGGNDAVGIGDYLAVINGQKANQAAQGMDNVVGGTYPATIEVALADNFTTDATKGCSANKSIDGCMQVRYLGAFTVTRQPDAKGVTGYFTALDPNAGGVVATGTSSGPLSEIKTRLVY